ncbi:MAG: hypothetical protein KBD12_00810 [Candidatus Pacebacteria bacterium]|nr:hypothetical protein [Candidatus Paceibacterota bacterium]
MINEHIFNNGKMENQVEKSLHTILSFSKENVKIFRIDDFSEAEGLEKNIFNEEDAVEISSIVSNLEDKNVFLLNEFINKDFFKLIRGLSNMIPKYGKKDSLKTSVAILNNISSNFEDEYIDNFKIRNDISLLRSLGNINILAPADANETEYLLRVYEKTLFKNVINRFSYFRLSSLNSSKIFKDDYFIKEGNLKEYTGLPEIIYLSKNINSPFEVAIISYGPIIHNVLYAAKELEAKNYKVSVLNFSLISSNNENVNQKIKHFINNFSNNNKNILVVEEHSKIGGLGSFIAETILENRNDKHIRLERMGIEDDLSPRNIISKAEEIISL